MSAAASTLAAARAHAARGALAESWAGLRTLDPLALEDPALALAAGRLAADLGDHALAQGFAARGVGLAASSAAWDAARVLYLAAQLALRAGRYGDCQALSLRAAALVPGELGLREAAAHLLQTIGAYESALGCLTLAPGSRPAGAHRLQLRAAELLLTLGRTHEAGSMVARLLEEHPDNAALHAVAGDKLVHLGDFAGAQRCYRQALTLDSELAAAQAGLGWLALWREDVSTALSCAERALAREPADVRAQLLHAAARLWRGDSPAGVLPALDHCVDAAPADSETRMLRARARSLAADPRGALADLLAAKPTAAETQLWMLDLEMLALGRRHYGPLSIEDLTSFASAVGQQAPLEPLALRRRNAESLLRKAERKAWRLAGSWSHALQAARSVQRAKRQQRIEEELPVMKSARFDALTEHHGVRTRVALLGGNRSATPTFVDPATGELVPLRLQRSPRDRAKTAQWVRSMADVDAALATLAVVEREFPHSPHPYAYRGEFLLWLGRYEEAAADFRRGLQVRPSARWLYIGMGAYHLLHQRYDEALASFRQSIAVAPGLLGPPLVAYRGETYRRMGDLRAAFTELDGSCRRNPGRVSSWANLWLVHEALGHGAGCDEVWAELLRRAPGFLSFASQERFGVGLPMVAAPGPAERRALLEHLLTMMRGNRSSTYITYVTAAGELRVVPPGG